MIKPLIAITGATGFIGKQLSEFLSTMGYSIIQLVRNNGGLASDASSRAFDLREKIIVEQFQDVDILIHCAYDFEDSPEKDINYPATVALVASARSASVKKFIFFSSVSAHEKAGSHYGKTKLRQESLFDQQKDAIIKSALVMGNGGLFKRLLNHVRTKKYVPLIHRGSGSFQVIAIEDILIATQRIIEKELTGTFVLANREHWTYKSFFQILGKLTGRRLAFVNIHPGLLKFIVGLFAVLGIRLPITKENIKGLENMRSIDSDESLKRLEIEPQSLETAYLQLKT